MFLFVELVEDVHNIMEVVQSNGEFGPFIRNEPVIGFFIGSSFDDFHLINHDDRITI